MLALLFDYRRLSMSGLYSKRLSLVHFKVIVGGMESCGDIVSVSCTENEIFILKGDRDIMRVSNCPEGLASNSKAFTYDTFYIIIPYSV